MKTNLDIVIDVAYKYAKFWYEILCIVGYTEMTKSDKIGRFEIYILRSTCLLFLCSPEYKVFKHDYLHICGINSWLHPNIFFILFLKLGNMIFFKGSLVPICTKSQLIVAYIKYNKNGHLLVCRSVISADKTAATVKAWDRHPSSFASINVLDSEGSRGSSVQDFHSI
jgi:hypothetical protein